jgi:RNA polymerase sigma factor (sigma-70 family)
MTNGRQLLGEYARSGSDAAFREIVSRYIDLVYSTAVRLVDGDRHRAEDVVQVVFTDLARKAAKLAPGVRLGGWVHRHTCFVAANIMRNERRRQSREKEAVEMNALEEGGAVNFSLVAPVLDEAINDLGDEDRTAVLLRFYERHDFRAVGEALGSTEDAARMRIKRALEKLELLLKRRGIMTTAGALSAALMANAVEAAPPGLATAISAGAVLTGAVAVSGSATAVTKAIAMTTMQKIAIGGTLAVLAGAGIYESHQTTQLREQVRSLQEQQAPLQEQVQQLEGERDEATNRVASLMDENSGLKKDSAELLALRGEVGELRHSLAATQKVPAPSPAANTAPGQDQPSSNVGRELGEAIVRGEQGAVGKLSDLAKFQTIRLLKNGTGLNDTQRDQLTRELFEPTRTAFEVINAAAVSGNSIALKAINEMTGIPELRGQAIESLGALASAGNNDALAILLNGSRYTFPAASTVGALVPVATSGNEQAIEALIEVTKDSSQKPLWMMAANGLAKAAETGNSAAIDALAGLLTETNQNIQWAAAAALKNSAAHENPRAEAALKAAGMQ